MRCAFSLLAVGITIALTAAQPVLTLISIKAVDSASENKDSWSVKGYISDPDAGFVDGIAEYGLDAELQDSALDTLDGVTERAGKTRAPPKLIGFAAITRQHKEHKGEIAVAWQVMGHEVRGGDLWLQAGHACFR